MVTLHTPSTRSLRFETICAVFLFWLPFSICRGQTILGPLDAVTGVDNFQITYGGFSYVYDVSFATNGATFGQAYSASPPTFLGNFAGAQLAATELAFVFDTAGVTHVAGAFASPISPGGPVQEELMTPYDLSLSTGEWMAEETDYISNRSPAWIPVGPGCCAGGIDSSADYVVYNLVSKTPAPASAPEPGTLALMMLGLIALLVARVGISRRREHQRIHTTPRFLEHE